MAAFGIALIDFDGTLVATHPAVAACLRRTLEEAAHAVPPDHEIAAVIARGLALPETFRAVAPALAADQVERCVDRYRIHYPAFGLARSVLYEGVQTSLSRLSAMGVAVVVLSNKGHAAVDAALAHFGLASSVRHVLADEPGQPTKPDPDVFHRRIAPLFAARPSADYIMVGDTEADLRFAQAVGVRSCWASYGYGHVEACRSIAPDYEIARFSELIDIVGGRTARPQHGV
jgi:phosphoglycolate phosphatase